MTQLLEIPFIMMIAKWIWEGDDVVTPIQCVDEFPLMSSGCWSRLIVKGLGIAIIAGACLNKAPIMMNLLSTQSTEGLSRFSMYGEIIMYTNGALYGILEKHPFTAFGENVALAVQCVMIVYLLWKYSSQQQNSVATVSIQEKIVVTVLIIGYVTSAITFVPDQYRYLLISSNVPILLYARGIQVIETIRVQHTGAQSIVTLVMNLVGALIRIGTTIKEVGWDFAVLFSFGLSLSLTSTMFVQYFYYRKNTEAFVAKLKQQSDIKKQQ